MMRNRAKLNKTQRPNVKLTARKLVVERLEQRCLMAGLGSGISSEQLAEYKTGPLAKTGQDTIDLIREYQQWRSATTASTPISSFSPTLAPLTRFEAGAVEMEIIVAGNFAAAGTKLEKQGVKIGPSDPEFSVITGMVPLDKLETIALDPIVLTMRPILLPRRSSSSNSPTLGAGPTDGATTNVGSVNSQAVAGQNVTAARNAFNVNGAGVKVGVLSDSVSKFRGGLADSQASGDLGPVQVIQDAPQGSDEGRAMLELVKDIAPGAPLAFATAFVGGQTGFAQNIDKLRTAGSDVIVDDISYFAEPFFQPGVIDSAIKRAVDANIPYVSSAGNSAKSGFELNVSGTWNIGGQYDWKAGTGVDTRLRVTIDRSSIFIFQWDDAYNGIASPGKVKTDLDLVFYNTAGTEVFRTSTNNIATGAPVEIVQGGPFTLDVAIERVAGPMPSRMKLVAIDGNLTTEYAFARSTTFGHNAGPWTIGVGAVPFYEAPAFSSVLPIKTESFSSAGPATHVFDSVTPNRRLDRPVTYQNPFISGVDNVNTSFFIPGNDISQDSDTFPNFSGTSAAAPDVAAVIALMREKFPTARVNQIAQALADSAKPTNGTAAGKWDNVGGYGLIDALAAMNLLQATLAGGQVVDNSDATFSASSRWVRSTGTTRYDSDSAEVARSATIDRADHTFFYLPKGTYDVLARWLPNSTRSTAVRYEFFDGDRSESFVNVNQRLAPTGPAFKSLQWKNLKQLVVTQGSVMVRVVSSATGTVSTDAIRLKFVSSSTSPLSAPSLAAPLVATNVTTSNAGTQTQNASPALTNDAGLENNKHAVNSTPTIQTIASSSLQTLAPSTNSSPANRAGSLKTSLTESTDVVFADLQSARWS